MKKLVAIIAVMAGFYTASVAQSQQLSVKVKNVKSEQGTIIVSLFNSEENFLKKAYKEVKSKAKNGEMKFVFDAVPSGEYTLSVVHDENGNGELDSNFIGMPTEPYGISKEGKSSYGPPSYSTALFKIENSDESLIVNL